MSLIEFTRTDQLTPPHNLGAEQALLGALLLNNEVCERVCDIVDAKHFFEPVHGEIYAAALKMIQVGRLANPLTLKPVFENAPWVGNLSVPQYLATLLGHAGSAQAAKDYAKQVRELSLRRSLIVIGEDISAAAHDTSGGEAAGLVEEAESHLFALIEHTAQAMDYTFAQAMQEALQITNDAYKGKKIPGLSTGITDLDERLGGLQSPDLIILAGRPSMGKTALATNIAYNVAKTNAAVDFYSLEMSAAQIGMRILGEEGGIASSSLRRGKVSETQFRSLVDKVRSIEGKPFYINQTGGLSIAHLAAKARRNKRLHNTQLIVIDYVQLMTASNTRGGNRVQEITEITTGLKALAKELSVPIIALSQLSRNVEHRPDKRPQLSDLRESGSIEQDADIVMFVYRDDYYLERSPPDETDLSAYSDWSTKMASLKGKAEVILAKHRHEQTGTVHLAFQSDLTRFSNLATPEGRRPFYHD